MKFEDVRIGDVIADGSFGTFVVTHKEPITVSGIYRDGRAAWATTESPYAHFPMWRLISRNKCVIVMVGDEDDYEDARLSKLASDRMNSVKSFVPHEEAWK